MRIKRLKISGSFLLFSSLFQDDRGLFDPFWEKTKEFEEITTFFPTNAAHSYNIKQHTLRGLHYQSEPYSQTKLISCFQGSIFDVIVDLRPESSTYLQWEGINLFAASGQSVLIPKGCAHGFATLEPNSGVTYLMDGEYKAQHAKVLRWNDPNIKIAWPHNFYIMSEKDRTAPDFLI